MTLSKLIKGTGNKIRQYVSLNIQSKSIKVPGWRSSKSYWSQSLLLMMGPANTADEDIKPRYQETILPPCLSSENMKWKSFGPAEKSKLTVPINKVLENPTWC